MVEKIKERGGLINYHSVVNQLKPYELNITYFDALGGIEPFLASQVIEISLAGVPGIYFLSLFGGQNWLQGVEKTGENRSINREKFNYQKLTQELANKNSLKHQVYSQYKNLLQTRINEPLFSPNVDQQIIEIHPKIFALIRFSQKEKLCLVNVSKRAIDVDSYRLKKVLEKDLLFDLISKSEINLGDKNSLVLAPYQSLWLK